jgi:hypothetical protein
MNAMNFIRLSVALALAWFLAASVAASLLAAVLVRLTARLWVDRPVVRARWLFGLRMLPAATSLLFVSAVFVPAFLRLEPHDTAEPVGPILGLLAVIAAGLLATGVRRGARALRAVRRQTATWLRDAEPLPVDASIRSYLVRDDFPVMSLVGLFRPRLFVARQVLDGLTCAEFQAAVAHEIGHRSSRDNLKRLAFICAPDLLASTGFGAELAREWAQAAELAADARASRGNRSRGLDLAAALIKVGRLATTPAPIGLPCSTLHDGGDIADRVRCLTGDAPADTFARMTGRTGLAVALGLATAVLAVVVCSHAVPHVVQALTEFLVRAIG